MASGLSRKEAAIVEACYFKPRYSGRASEKFWKEVNAQDDMTLYRFACALQDVESRVLATVNDRIRARVRALVISQRKT